MQQDRSTALTRKPNPYPFPTLNPNISLFPFSCCLAAASLNRATTIITPPYLYRRLPLPLHLRHLARCRPSSVAHFPVLPNFGISNTSWGFYLSKRIIYSLQSPLPDQSSWIIKLDRDNLARMRLLNPLDRSQFNSFPSAFPKLFSFFNIRVRELGEEYALQYINFRPTVSSIGEIENLYMEKVVVLNNGSNGEFVLLTIHVSGKLVVYKSGDERWRLINDLPSLYDDEIIWKGKLYDVDNTGRIVVVNTVDLNVSVVANSIFGGDKRF